MTLPISGKPSKKFLQNMEFLTREADEVVKQIIADFAKIDPQSFLLSLSS